MASKTVTSQVRKAGSLIRQVTLQPRRFLASTSCLRRTDAASGNGNRNRKPRYSVGVFGCGRIATTHIRNILRNRRLDLKWILDDDVGQVNKIKSEFYLGEDFPVFTTNDTDRLLSEKSLDAVFVLSPTPTHAEYICTSLAHGKGVFAEKPAAETYTDIKQCFEAAENNGRPFVTGFTRRFDSVFIDMKEAYDKSIGTPHIIKATTRDSPKPSYEFLSSSDTSGCNILADLGVHDIDMLSWITKGMRPESIFVNCHVHDSMLKKVNEPDTMASVIKYPNGLLALVDVVRDSCYGYDIRLELFGTDGMAVAENPRENSSVIDQSGGAKMRRLYYSFPQRFEKAFEAEVQHFVECLDGDATPLVTKEESLCTAEIIDKGVQSYLTGQVVKF